MDAFNFKLIKFYLDPKIIWAFDLSYISKSDGMTYGVGYFWSGCVQVTRWGMGWSIATVDIKNQQAWYYTKGKMPLKNLTEYCIMLE